MQLENITLYNGECIEIMKTLQDKSIDMILCDLPYGVLNKSNKEAQWDSIIPMQDLWEQYKRIIKDKGNIVLFAQGLFTAELIISNKKMWKYNLVWKKGKRVTGFLNSNRQPLRQHEDIIIFNTGQGTYNPQMIIESTSHYRGGGKRKIIVMAK